MLRLFYFERRQSMKCNRDELIRAGIREECYVCGKNGDTLASAYWGEDNVGLINLNNFDLLYLGINRYVDGGELVQEHAGVMLSSGLTDQEADSYAHAYVFPDNAY
jgi:hypothetical protein